MSYVHNSDEEAIYTIEPTRMRTDPLYIRVYILWMNLIVQIVVPFALLVFLNIKIFQRVKQLEARIARNSFGFAHSLSREKDDEKASNGGGGCLECGRGFLGEMIINKMVNSSNGPAAKLPTLPLSYLSKIRIDRIDQTGH